MNFKITELKTEDEKEKITVKETLYAIWMVSLVVPFTLLRAYILFQIWNWYMFPQFKYYMPFSLSLGINFIRTFFSANGLEADKSRKATITQLLIELLLVWLLAYCVKVWFL